MQFFHMGRPIHKIALWHKGMIALNIAVVLLEYKGTKLVGVTDSHKEVWNIHRSASKIQPFDGDRERPLAVVVTYVCERPVFCSVNDFHIFDRS